MLTTEMVVVKMLKLPTSVRAMDIRRFFNDIHIPDGGVHIVSSNDSCEAYITFREEDAARAMERNSGTVRGCQIQLCLSTKKEMDNVVSRPTHSDGSHRETSEKRPQDPRQYSSANRAKKESPRILNALTDFIGLHSSEKDQHDGIYKRVAAQTPKPPKNPVCDIPKNNVELLELLRTIQDKKQVSKKDQSPLKQDVPLETDAKVNEVDKSLKTEPFIYIDLKRRDSRFKLSLYTSVKKILTPLCNNQISLCDIKKVNDFKGQFSGRILFRVPGLALDETNRIICEIRRLVTENDGVSRASPELQITDVGLSSHYEFENQADAYLPFQIELQSFNDPFESEFIIKIDKLPANFENVNVASVLQNVTIDPSTQILKTRPDFMDTGSFLVFLPNSRDLERALFYNDELIDDQNIAVVAVSKEQAKWIRSSTASSSAVVSETHDIKIEPNVARKTRFDEPVSLAQHPVPMFPYPPPPIVSSSIDPDPHRDFGVYGGFMIEHSSPPNYHRSSAYSRRGGSRFDHHHQHQDPCLIDYTTRKRQAFVTPMDHQGFHPRKVLLNHQRFNRPPIRPYARASPNAVGSAMPLPHHHSSHQAPPPPSSCSQQVSTFRTDCSSLPPIPIELHAYKGRVLLLNNIPYRAEKHDICQWLQDFEPLEETLKISHDETGKPTGHAIVACSSPASARQARAILSGTSFFGRYVNIVLV
ncbi:hypothetical protein ACOME3_001681 [Neoechinorhynchus agilis]